MDKINILYNPHAGNGNGESFAKNLLDYYSGKKLDFVDMTKIGSYADFLSSLDADEKIVVAGGDGTLHCFVNGVYDIERKNDIYYYAAGSGNDFLVDLGMKKGAKPFLINKYIEKLPLATVDGKSYRFLNNMSFGIDGYCCEEGDRVRQKTAKPVNYTSIAIKGVLFKYRPTNARITLDGGTKEYEKVWLAPAMNGRFCGGGMMLAPNQDRLADERKLSFLIMHGAGSLKTLTMFPSVFTGTQEKYAKHVQIITAKSISVEFARPVAAQIDGETILNVTRYDAVTYDLVHEKQKETIK